MKIKTRKRASPGPVGKGRQCQRLNDEMHFWVPLFLNQLHFDVSHDLHGFSNALSVLSHKHSRILLNHEDTKHYK